MMTNVTNNTVRRTAVHARFFARIRKTMTALAAITALLSASLFAIPTAQAKTAGGGAYGSYHVCGSEVELYTVNFIRGEGAEVGLEGDGSSDLDLCYTGFFVPRSRASRTATYTIKVVNRGRNCNDFDLLAN